MPVVHVWSVLGRFQSLAELNAYAHAEYNDDGDAVPSRFMREVGLRNHEPACIEVEHFDDARPLRESVEGASYGEQWASKIRPELLANSIICVYAPNEVYIPNASSLTYQGAFEYES